MVAVTAVRATPGCCAVTDIVVHCQAVDAYQSRLAALPEAMQATAQEHMILPEVSSRSDSHCRCSGVTVVVWLSVLGPVTLSV